MWRKSCFELDPWKRILDLIQTFHHTHKIDYSQFCAWSTLWWRSPLRNKGKGFSHEHLMMQYFQLQSNKKWYDVQYLMFRFLVSTAAGGVHLKRENHSCALVQKMVRPGSRILTTRGPGADPKTKGRGTLEQKAFFQRWVSILGSIFRVWKKKHEFVFFLRRCALIFFYSPKMSKKRFRL